MPGGAGTAYHFNADGTFSFAGLLVIGSGCSSSDFVWRQGNATVSGNQLTLTDTLNQIDTGDCTGGTTQSQGLGTVTLGWSIDATGTLSLTDPDPNVGTLTYAKQ
jgi:hypothetical protein